MKRKVVNVSADVYAELVVIKGQLEQERKENVSLEEVIAYLLDFYKSREGEQDG
jgi:predicted CopG family antitoxin